MINRSTDGKQRALSLSYGKDSLACLGAIEQLGIPLDRIKENENCIIVSTKKNRLLYSKPEFQLEVMNGEEKQ